MEAAFRVLQGPGGLVSSWFDVRVLFFGSPPLGLAKGLDIQKAFYTGSIRIPGSATALSGFMGPDLASSS